MIFLFDLFSSFFWFWLSHGRDSNSAFLLNKKNSQISSRWISHSVYAKRFAEYKDVERFYRILFLNQSVGEKIDDIALGIVKRQRKETVVANQCSLDKCCHETNVHTIKSVAKARMANIVAVRTLKCAVRERVFAFILILLIWKERKKERRRKRNSCKEESLPILTSEKHFDLNQYLYPSMTYWIHPEDEVERILLQVSSL